VASGVARAAGPLMVTVEAAKRLGSPVSLVGRSLPAAG